MNKREVTKGFSLTEVLISIGILGAGILLVAGVFPVAIYFATVATERTVASAIAEEAFSKIRLYASGSGNIMEDESDSGSIRLGRLETGEHRAIAAVDNPTELDEIRNILPSLPEVSLTEELWKYHSELIYPSADVIVSQEDYDNSSSWSEDTRILERQEYCWSAIMRLADPNTFDRLVQVTVFVCRRGGRNVRYHETDIRGKDDDTVYSLWPQPMRIEMEAVTGGLDNELEFLYPDDDRTYINGGYTIIDDETGQLYKVIERYQDQVQNVTLRNVIKLDRKWDGSLRCSVWVIPPPLVGGKNPCIGVFQRLIRF